MTADAGVEDRIGSISDKLFSDMGVVNSRLASAYIRRSSSCGLDRGLEPGLGKNEGWYARKRYVLKDSVQRSDDDLYADAVRSVREQGFVVTEYAARSPSRARIAVGLREDVSVRVSVPPIDVLISAGPCGASFTQVADIYTEVAP